jgi:hypothetical protein
VRRRRLGAPPLGADGHIHGQGWTVLMHQPHQRRQEVPTTINPLRASCGGAYCLQEKVGVTTGRQEFWNLPEPAAGEARRVLLCVAHVCTALCCACVLRVVWAWFCSGAG